MAIGWASSPMSGGTRSKAASPTDKTDAVAGYSAAAPRLIPALSTLDPVRLLAPVRDHLPTNGQSCLDIGAGTGTVARFLSDRGCAVTAMEPAAPLRAHGAHTTGPRVTWIDSRLPDLPGIDGLFDSLLLSAVWHHVPPTDRAAAAVRLTELCRPGGTLIMSLRHGPTPVDRPGWPCPPDAVHASFPGFTVLRQTEGASLQPANIADGVTWTWLVIGRDQ